VSQASTEQFSIAMTGEGVKINSSITIAKLAIVVLR